MLMYISSLQEGNLVCDSSIILLNQGHFLYLQPQLTSLATSESRKYYLLKTQRPLFTIAESEKL